MEVCGSRTAAIEALAHAMFKSSTFVPRTVGLQRLRRFERARGPRAPEAGRSYLRRRNKSANAEPYGRHINLRRLTVN